MTTEGLNGNLVKSIISANNKQDLMAVLPPCWDSPADFQSHIETIMHMCFLGVSQTVGMVLKTVLNKGQLYTKFHSGDNHLKNIRTLQLDFCKCWIFGSQNTPFGPWVSENTLGYVRIMKLLYSNILDELKNDKIRKLSKQVIQSWVSVVARVMQDAVDNELLSDIDRHVKNFLTILCKLEQEVDSGNKHKIETTSNLAGLLNITTFMKEVGPLRLYWEGGYKGEGLLRYIKPLVKQGIHKPTFAKNLFNKYYSDRFLQLVLGLDIQYNEDDTETVPMERYTKLRTYLSIQRIREDIENGEAVSAIIKKDGTLCCSFLEDKVHKICAINTNDGKGKIFKSSYVSCLSTGDSETFDRRNITDISSDIWGLALPIKQEKNKKNYF